MQVNPTRSILFKVILSCMTIVLLCLTSGAMAADITILPLLRITGEYDDNVGFSRNDERDDYIAIVGPALDLEYRTEKLSLKSEIGLDFYRFRDIKELDTEKKSLYLGTVYSISEKISIDGAASYLMDTTLQSELDETGIVDFQTDRERLTLQGGATWRISELSDMALNLTLGKTEYEWEGYSDYDSEAISLSYNRQLKNQKDVFTLQPYYSRYASNNSKVKTWGISLGWRHPFNEKLSLTAFLGARYTDTRYSRLVQESVPDPRFPPFLGINMLTYTEVDETDNNWGGTVDSYLSYKGETFSAGLGLNRDLAYSSTGDPIDRTMLYLTINRDLTRRLRASFSCNLSSSESEGRFSKENSRHMSLGPRLRYRITEDHSLLFAYEYALHEDRTIKDDSPYDRSRFWVSLDLGFPRKWQY